jgi:hypothetical protein
MLAALAALHARGIIHRDLKPSNVFRTPHGVKLPDFGLARPEAERALDTQTALTGSGMVIGTPRYMAPEQIVGGHELDARSDLHRASVTHPGRRRWQSRPRIRPVRALRRSTTTAGGDDPEPMFNQGWLLCDVGEYEHGIAVLARAVAKGYSVAPTLTRSRVFDAARDHPVFQRVLAQAEADRDAARRAFHEAEGERLLTTA